MSKSQLNVFGKSLEMCCSNPMTGYYRTGYCSTSAADTGTHTVCAKVTSAFLQHQKRLGNDLITPNLHFFPGLKDGDKWCLCAKRWKQGLDAGVAPNLFLESTNLATCEVLGMSLEDLLPFAIQRDAVIDTKLRDDL